MIILINDGLSAKAITELEKSEYEVKNVHVAPSQLANYINKNKINVLVVRSATQVTREILEACTSLKLIIRAGIGVDNIDLIAAKELGVKVKNTPGVSSRSVAELAMAHIYTRYRHLHDANRNMPLEGDSRFNQLKKSYENAIEVNNKTLGILGFGSIGKEVAKLAYANGMRVITLDRNKKDNILSLQFVDGQRLEIEIPLLSFDKILEQSDVISIHTPALENYLIDAKEIEKMKTGGGIMNNARGGILNEKAALDALEKANSAFDEALTALENANQANSTANNASQVADSAFNKSIKSSSVTYAVGTSGTTAPTSGWQSTVPSVSASQYLWTRTVFTLQDNSTTTSYSVSKQGAKGDKGDKGDTGATGATGSPGANGTPGQNAPTITSVREQFYLST